MTMSKTAFGPFEALLQGGGQAAEGISAEKLAMAGRRAAAQYVDNGVPLNDSLTKEASALDGVEREHVQRMCETANHTTFNAKFAAAQGDMRAPEFPVADASEVWDRLGNPGTEKTAHVSTPLPGGITEKTASVTSLDDYRIAPKPFHRSRGAEVMDKVASVADEERVVPKLAHANPMGHSLRLRTKLSAVRDTLGGRVGQLELSLDSEESLLVTKMAEALKEGHAPEELLVIFGQADGSDAGIKHASGLLVRAVEAAIPKHRHGQIKLAFDNELVQSLQYKEASPASPIYRGFSNLSQIRDDLAVAKVAHARVEDALKVQRDQLVGMLQEKEAGALGGALGAVVGGVAGDLSTKPGGNKALRPALGAIGGGLAGHAGQQMLRRRAAKKSQSDVG